ncbi:MAG: hypothetical protein AB1742_06810 [bacterium]
MDGKRLTLKLRELLDPADFRLVCDVGATAQRAGFRAFLVGGPVRDLLSAGALADVDFAIEGDAAKTARALARKYNARLTVFERFLTCRLTLPDGSRFDLASTRREVYPGPGALPKVFPADVGADLLRRDFSINAMAVELTPPRLGLLLDPFRGRDDLRDRKLRVLHENSFRDDPTRILRGIRFQPRLHLEWERRTRALLDDALKSAALDTVSGARLKKEVFYILEMNERAAAVESMVKLCVPQALSPGAVFSPDLLSPTDRVARALRSLPRAKFIESIHKPLLYFLAVARLADDKALRSLAGRLAFTARERKCLLDGASGARAASRCAAAGELGETYLALRSLEPEAALLAYASEKQPRARCILKKCLSIPPVKLAVSGDDLRRLGFKPSPDFGETLREVLKMKLEGAVKGKAAELAAAEKILRGKKL